VPKAAWLLDSGTGIALVEDAVGPDALNSDPLNSEATRRRARAICAAVGAAFLALASSAPAGAANWFEKNGYLIGPRYDSNLPACEDSWALSQIQRRFATKESRFWNSDLQITTFDHIREVAYRPWADGTIPRRFCSGRAQTSDGHWRALHYSIVEDGGMIGASWGVQWCVVGVDRNWAYNPDCRAALP
jgi:hypothetical protein